MSWKQICIETEVLQKAVLKMKLKYIVLTLNEVIRVFMASREHRLIAVMIKFEINEYLLQKFSALFACV